MFPAEMLIEAKAAGLTINVNLGNTSKETWERHLAKLLSLPEGFAGAGGNDRHHQAGIGVSRSSLRHAGGGQGRRRPLTLPQP
jgi:hypothetical protein